MRKRLKEFSIIKRIRKLKSNGKNIVFKMDFGDIEVWAETKTN